MVGVPKLQMPVFRSVSRGQAFACKSGPVKLRGLFSIILARLQAIKSVLVAFAGAKVRTIRHISKLFS